MGTLQWRNVPNKWICYMEYVVVTLSVIYRSIYIIFDKFCSEFFSTMIDTTSQFIYYYQQLPMITPAWEVSVGAPRVERNKYVAGHSRYEFSLRKFCRKSSIKFRLFITLFQLLVLYFTCILGCLWRRPFAQPPRDAALRGLEM